MMDASPLLGRVLVALGHFKLDAVIMRPFYPVSRLYRVVDDATGLKADFMPVIHGFRFFEGLRKRASLQTIGRQAVLVASLDDIIASKKAAGRERDLAVPIEQRMNFLRKRLPGGGSCL